MNRADLIEIVSSQVGVPKVSVDRLISSMVEAIQSALANGDAVTLAGFGTFKTSPVGAGAGDDVHTGGPVAPANAIVPRFYADCHSQADGYARARVSLGDEAGDGFDEQPDALELSHQMAQALSVISACHPRMAKAIGSFWGFPECRDYLSRIAVDGWDPHIHESVGFNAEVLGAIRTLQSIHSLSAR